MPSSPPFTFRSVLKQGLRFCGSCVVTLACWSIWLALSATLVVLIYVAVARELPVPDFVLRRVEARLAEANLVIKFGRARFDPTGRILLEDVRLRSRRFEEPLLTSRLVFVRRSIWSILSGRPIPDEIRLEGAALQLPAMLSPSGTTEPLLRDLAVVLRHEENLWHLDQLTGRIGPVAVTAQGAITPPARAGGVALSIEEVADRFLQIGRRLVLEVHQFDAFDEPALSVRLDNPPGVGNTATVLFTARAARQPWKQPLTLGPLAVTATLRLDGSRERTLRLHAATRDARYGGAYAVDNVRAVISALVVPEKLSARPVEVLVAAGSVTAQGESALGPVLRANLTGWPNEVRAAVATQLSGEFLAAEVEANLHEQSARLRAAGRGAPGLINRVLARRTPRAAPYFVFTDPVEFTAEATLAAGWRFERLAGRVAVGRLDSHGVNIKEARGRIDLVGTSFLAHDARVVMGENEARGSYWGNFATTDYRMLLTGRLRPLEINGWFRGEWWQDFWGGHFAFPAAPPEGDVDVSGRWRDVGRSEFFGRAEATGPVLLGATFDRARTLIYLRPHFTHALELSAQRAGGAQRVDGWFKRLGDPVGRETRAVQFGLDSSVDADTYHRLGGARADAVLAGLQFSQPPRVHAEGVLEANGAGFTPRLTFSGVAQGGLHFYGFPVEFARANGGLSGDDLRLDDIQVTVAGGQGGGKAVMNGTGDARRLGFDMHVTEADLARSIRAVEEFNAARTGQKGESMAESKFIERASGGRLEVSLAAQGRPGDLDSFTGTGKAGLKGMELAEIHLFGLLSQVLSGLSLNFSSLKLDTVHTSFRMEGGRLLFPDLRINGPNAVIDGRGDFAFATTALDFTAKFKPFEEHRNILTATLGIVINPIASILELKLTGPISKPNWSVVVGSSAPRPELTAPAPAPTQLPPPAPVTPPKK